MAQAKEDKFTRTDELDGTRDVGDLADHKVFFGVTGRTLQRKLAVTLRGRYIGPRNVVAGNPIGWRLESTDEDGNVSYDNTEDASYSGSLYEPCGRGDAPACPEGTGYGDGKVDAYLTLTSPWYGATFSQSWWTEPRTQSRPSRQEPARYTVFPPGHSRGQCWCDPGVRDDSGVWQGSRGWSNSLLPAARPATDAHTTGGALFCAGGRLKGSPE